MDTNFRIFKFFFSFQFTYGVNAWRHWVVGKNAELEKARSQGKYIKAFETDILKLRADELNYTLCMFVKEVKKPNGEPYASDSIFYLTLGIQVRNRGVGSFENVGGRHLEFGKSEKGATLYYVLRVKWMKSAKNGGNDRMLDQNGRIDVRQTLYGQTNLKVEIVMSMNIFH